MKKTLCMVGIVVLVMTGLCLSDFQTAYARMDWSTLKDFTLDAEPLGIVSSPDGKIIYILTRGEIRVYDVSEEKVTDRIPVDAAFDQLIPLGKGDELILVSRSNRAVKMIKIEPIYDIDVSGLPIKGNPNASVTIAVFSDYQ